MKIYRLLFLISIICISISQDNYSGFVAGTLVKVPNGYEPIEQLIPGNPVYSVDKQGDVHISKISKTISYMSSDQIIFEL